MNGIKNEAKKAGGHITRENIYQRIDGTLLGLPLQVITSVDNSRKRGK
jgi:hypothetical protein